MITKTVRIAVDLLEDLKRKLIKDGKPPQAVDEYLGPYINEILWAYVNAGEVKQLSNPKFLKPSLIQEDEGQKHGRRRNS